MAEMNDIVKLAVDAYRGRVEKYSENQSMDVLRQALVEANGGSTVLDYKKIRDGECKGLFTLIETILSRTVVEGLQGDEFFNAMVDFRNVAEGDKNLFVVEDDNLFVVAEAADGTQGIRRQRLGGSTRIRPTMPAMMAPSMASMPRVAEMARVSTSAMSIGSAPDWISIARLRAQL